MFLGVVGFAMIVIIVAALIRSKSNPVPLFVIVPVIAALICGFTPAQIFEFVKAGVGKTWSTAVLFIFSIVYFSMMGDMGLFDPMVNWLVKKAGSNIVMVTVATSLIAVISHLDGALASTLLITIPAMLPIYKKLHMRPVVLVCIIGAAMSIMNLLPWGGPVARTGVVLNADVNVLWQELIPLQGVGLVILVAFAAYMGVMEKRRGAGLVPTGKAAELSEENSNSSDDSLSDADKEFMARPKMIWFNGLLTLFVIGLLTGVHCIGMCGGILLAQGNALLYNGGRLLSYTLMGAVFGALGKYISYDLQVRSMLLTVSGLLVVLIGLRMWGVPFLRRISPELTKPCRFRGKAFAVGLLTGLMPCGALSSMWIFAASSGSWASGAVSMLAFGAGTCVFMLLFGLLGAFIPKRYNKYLLKASTILIVALGLSLMTKGIRLLA